MGEGGTDGTDRDGGREGTDTDRTDPDYDHDHDHNHDHSRGHNDYHDTGTDAHAEVREDREGHAHSRTVDNASAEEEAEEAMDKERDVGPHRRKKQDTGGRRGRARDPGAQQESEEGGESGQERMAPITDRRNSEVGESVYTVVMGEETEEAVLGAHNEAERQRRKAGGVDEHTEGLRGISRTTALGSTHRRVRDEVRRCEGRSRCVDGPVHSR